jgi:hypothetical protein
MTKPTKTQAERLFVHLRRKAMTYGEMEALGISTCPWKRLEEGRYLLREGEKLVRGKRGDLVTWRVVKAKEVAEA